LALVGAWFIYVDQSLARLSRDDFKHEGQHLFQDFWSRSSFDFSHESYTSLFVVD
jgi:hypothetical protein